MKLISSLVLILFTQIIFAQSSIIKGVVIEENTGKPLSGVNIVIKSIKKSTISDSEGNFIFRNLPVGNYSIQFSFLSFESKIVSDIQTVSNDTYDLTVSLVEKKNQLEDVVIKSTKAKTESVKSLLTLQKNSIRVSDGISAETIKRTPDRTTSDVLKRISGASVQDNKFVIIRGLNDRYNTTFLNGAPLPSSEPDRKAFSFDIFPANMIDNIVIYKTASPDLPGEFAGGVVEINTKATPDKDFQSLSISSGFNTITTGKNQLYYEGGKSDWLGVDDGTRGLPASFPSTTQFQALQQAHTQSSYTQISDLAKSYQTDWGLYNKAFSPNMSFQYTIGKFFKQKDNQNLGFLASVSYNKTNNYNQTLRKSYETPGALLTDQIDDNYNTQTLFGVLANVSLKMDSNNSFTFKNLYSINSNNRVIDRNGSISQDDPPMLINTTARMFTSNKIYTGQLAGEHLLTASKIKINWVGSYSNVVRSIPNDRRNTYNINPNIFGPGYQQPKADFQVNTVGSESPGSMYVSENIENIFSTKVDISRKINFTEKFATDVKIGFFTQSRYRDFSARQLGYVPFVGNINGYNYTSNNLASYIPFSSNSTIFNSSNMGIITPGAPGVPGVSGLTLFDGTKGNDTYKASSNLNAAYAMLDNSIGKFRVIWGVRMESYSQLLTSKSDSGTPINVDNSQIDFLPSLNLIYGVNKKQNLRLSFSKTLNRPEFRELAPFLFYDASTKFNTEGTPDLKIAKVFNADLRYEIFPGKGQLFSISAFYKKFSDPIELQAQANNSNKYENAKSGENKGIEMEYRTLLSSIFGSKSANLLEDITLFTNLSIIRSKVDISNLVTSSTLEEIPLQGQSPYVFNAGLQYIGKETGWSASANLNRIGDRIAIQGNQTVGASTPALWEKSRTFLDLQISKSFYKNKIEVKLNAQNVLAQDLIFYQNNDLGKTNVTGFNKTINSIFTGDSQNKNGYNSDEDDLVWLTKFGPTFSLSLSYSF
jgi:TonB-dependent receptor